jgi:hypothetical protein
MQIVYPQMGRYAHTVQENMQITEGDVPFNIAVNGGA